MTKKKMERANYVNISKRERKEKIKSERGETFVGCRPTYFADKTKYSRKQKHKKALAY